MAKSLNSQVLIVTGIARAVKTGEKDGKPWKVVSIPMNHYDFKTKTPGSTVWYGMFVNPNTPIAEDDIVTLTGVFDVDQIKPGQKDGVYNYTFPSFNSFALIAGKGTAPAVAAPEDDEATQYAPLD